MGKKIRWKERWRVRRRVRSRLMSNCSAMMQMQLIKSQTNTCRSPSNAQKI
jgi:hypothetical protein